VDEPVLLSVRNLETKSVSNISFDLRQGEILGFAGLIGSGRTEVAEAIVGLTHRTAGEIQLNGQVSILPGRQSVEAGIAYMTKDRKGKGLLLNMGLRPNLTLLTLQKHMRAGSSIRLAKIVRSSGPRAASTSAPGRLGGRRTAIGWQSAKADAGQDDGKPSRTSSSWMSRHAASMSAPSSKSITSSRRWPPRGRRSSSFPPNSRK
jgi:ABC-type dipeptide/oligopeptide/nickel transport system ATPase component